jgi:hypothetical protein
MTVRLAFGRHQPDRRHAPSAIGPDVSADDAGCCRCRQPPHARRPNDHQDGIRREPLGDDRQPRPLMPAAQLVDGDAGHALSSFDRFRAGPHAWPRSGDACAGSEHPTPRSPRRAATRSHRSEHSPGGHPSHGPRPHVSVGRPGKVLTGHDVQAFSRAAARRAPLARRASRGCAAPAATSRRRSAALLRHERLPDDSRPRPAHGRRGLSHLRFRAPRRLTRAAPADAPATRHRGTTPGTRPWTDRG